MIFDSGSAWVWLGTKYCQTCVNTNRFNPSESSSFKQLNMKQTALNYGIGSVYGYDASDTVCLDKKSVVGNGCMENYLFKAVVGQRDLNGFVGSGLIGLSPSGYGGA